jgi:hypothetical protein
MYTSYPQSIDQGVSNELSGLYSAVWFTNLFCLSHEHWYAYLFYMLVLELKIINDTQVDNGAFIMTRVAVCT